MQALLICMLIRALLSRLIERLIEMLIERLIERLIKRLGISSVADTAHLKTGAKQVVAAHEGRTSAAMRLARRC